MDILNGWNITLHFFTRLNVIQNFGTFKIFELQGVNFACDCIDFEVFKSERNTTTRHIQDHRL